MRQRYGFTLIELMVTLAIAAILVTVAVPGFQALFERNRVTTYANQLVAALSTARSEAIRRNETIQVMPTDCGTGWTSGFGVYEEGACSDGDDPIRVFDGTDLNMTVEDDDGDALSSLDFNGDGTLNADQPPVTLATEPDDCITDARREITVTLGGSTRTEQDSCS